MRRTGLVGPYDDPVAWVRTGLTGAGGGRYCCGLAGNIAPVGGDLGGDTGGVTGVTVAGSWTCDSNGYVPEPAPPGL